MRVHFLTLEATATLGLTPLQWLGVPIALLGAVVLALSAQLQHRGVRIAHAQTARRGSDRSRRARVMRLLTSRLWVIGIMLQGVAIVLQLVSLGFSPLTVVQPLGAVALVITAIVNARVTGERLSRSSITSIALSVSGIGVFVIVAAVYAENTVVTDRRLLSVLIILAVVLLISVLLFTVLRRHMTPLSYIVIAGTVYGFVATLAKTVIGRIQQNNVEWLTLLAIIALIAATALGFYFVQRAYAVGPPDLVIAGLTVIDPMVAVLIGMLVLGEAANAPIWAIAVWMLSAAVAVIGVHGVSKYHPALQDEPSSSA